MSFLCSCKERTKESTPRGRLRGALLELLHAHAGAQPHGGKSANTNGVSKTRGVSLRALKCAMVNRKTFFIQLPFSSFLSRDKK